MLKNIFLFLMLFGTNPIFCMEPVKTVEKTNSQEQVDIFAQLEEEKESDKVPSLVSKCSKSIANFLLDDKKFPNFDIDLNKLPIELINNIELNAYQNKRIWTILKNCIKGKSLGSKLEEMHKDSIAAVEISLDNKYVVTGSWDKTAKLWERASGKYLKTFEGHTSPVDSVLISKNNTFLITGSWDKTAKIWGIETGTCLRTFSHNTSIKTIAISEDNGILYTIDSNMILKTWNIQSGKCLYSHNYSPDLGHQTAAISVDNQLLVVAGHDYGSSDTGCIKIFNLYSGECLCSFVIPKHPIWSVAISPNKKFIVTGDTKGTLKILDVKTQKCLSTIERNFLNGHYNSCIESIKISSDNKFMITCSCAGSKDYVSENSVRIWDTTFGDCLHVLSKGSFVGAGFTDIAISKDMKFIVTACHFEKRAKVWQIDYPKLEEIIEIQKNKQISNQSCLMQ